MMLRTINVAASMSYHVSRPAHRPYQMLCGERLGEVAVARAQTDHSMVPRAAEVLENGDACVPT